MVFPLRTDGKKNLASLREMNAVSFSLKQRNLILLFQLTDMLADSRLPYVQCLTCFCNALQLRNFQKYFVLE